jgi:hypothetical protein
MAGELIKSWTCRCLSFCSRLHTLAPGFTLPGALHSRLLLTLAKLSLHSLYCLPAAADPSLFLCRLNLLYLP